MGLLSLSLSLSMPRAFLRSRAKSFFRRVSKRVRVLYSSVCYVFPRSCVFSTVFFFSLINLGFLSLFRHFKKDPVSETTFFRPFSSEHPPPEREREREREAAMKIHLKTLCVVLSKRFPGRRSFPSSLSTAPFFGSRLFEMDFFCLLF